MRNFFLNLVICILFLPTSSRAMTDSITFLTLGDTVFLEINDRGQKLLLHRLEKGQTLYSLSKFYGIDLDILYNYNPHVTPNKIVPLHTQITIPIPNKAIHRTLKKGRKSTEFVPAYYRVKQGDTVYGIAKRVFKMKVEDFEKVNPLENHSLRVGQVLKVGWLEPKPIPKKWHTNSTRGGFIHIENGTYRTLFLSKVGSKKTVKERGKAQWSKNDNIQQSGLYCLHRKAPEGSVIRIENALAKNVVYAKVLGKIPMNYEPSVMIVVSRDVAKALQEQKSTSFFVKVEHF